MNFDFKSTEFKKYLSRVLNKEVENITLEDITQIEELKLSKINFMRKETDYTLLDLECFYNLEKITLFKFVITKSDFEILNKLPKLKYIHFDFCDFENQNLELNSNITKICFSTCKNFGVNLLNTKNLESLKVIGDKDSKIEIDINQIIEMSYLEELFFNNFIIKNISEILIKFPSLKMLNIDGSIVNVNDISQIEEKIKISYEKIFILN